MASKEPTADPPHDPDQTRPAAMPGDALIGTIIGHYHIKRIIGSGGMGTVYEAVQQSPRRTVALKVMKHGIASKSALRRFEYESQILARLRHSGIAQVYEAGTHDVGSGGVPYFAMEYIPNARPITDYAVSKRLSTSERLELFMKVCDAVHHGHQKGIIHRDLKPGNILVDSSGQPKVIDFGVARATDSDMAITTLQTDVGQLIGTLQYMSPEQCDADPHDIDTRSDVYALGMVLYELLCEQLPYDLSTVAVYEAARVIREEPPTRPSSFNRTLRGDVETIALKALEKDRTRRYSSAADLGADIQRYLNNEPISARRASMMYQVRRFAKRNRTVVGGVLATFLVLIAGVVVSVAFAVEADRQREAAELATINEGKARQAEKERADELEKVAELQASQLSGIDTELMGVSLRLDIIEKRRQALAERGMGDDEVAAAIEELESSLSGVNFTNVALEMLDENIFERALTAIDTQFADQPLVQARLLQTVADTLAALGLLEGAMEPQTEALEIRRRILGVEHRDTLSSINNMGVLLSDHGRFAEAEQYYREAMEGYRRVLGDNHRDTLASINNMGLLFKAQSKFAEAEQHLREAMESRRRVLGDEDPDTLSSINNMAILLHEQGKYTEAEPLYREALETRRRILGDIHPSTLNSMNNMGAWFLGQGKPAEAATYFGEALEGFRQILGNEHPTTLTSISNMGAVLSGQSRYAEAEPYFREALESRRHILGDLHPDTLVSIRDMGVLMQQQEKYTDAEAYHSEALSGFRRVLGNMHPETLKSINSMGVVLGLQGKFADSAPFFRETLEGRRHNHGNDHPSTLIAVFNMAELSRNLGELEEAARLGSEAVTTARKVLPEGHWQTAQILNGYAQTLAAMERYTEAEAHMLEAHAIFEKSLGLQHERTSANMNALADFYDVWNVAEPGKGYDAKAAEWRAKLEAATANQVAAREDGDAESDAAKTDADDP